MISFPYPTVCGFLSQQNKEDLLEMARTCQTVPGDVVEVGSWQGLSTLCLCLGMGPSKRLISFDLLHNVNGAMLLQNLTDAGFVDQVELVPGDCSDTVPQRKLKSVALAFIDHDHKLITTQHMHDALWPVISPGGILAFHDYQHPDYPEPTPFLAALPYARHLERAGLIAFRK